MLLEVRDLQKYFTTSKMGRQSTIKAVDGVSFGVARGQSIGLVGESGCGKSTVARSVIGLYQPSGGQILFDGDDLAPLRGRQWLPYRRQMQIVFQDPYSSLPPRMTIEEILTDPLIIHKIGTKAQRRERILELMEVVGLDQRYIKRYPHEFSGGQRQRICIARALVLNPQFVILDEAVSALDVSVQSQVVNLLKQCQERFDLTYLFISHDLSLIEYFCDRVAVMYLGRIVELGDRTQVFSQTAHPYTQALLSAIPQIDAKNRRQRLMLKGDIPSAANAPPGCVFHTRCGQTMEVCKTLPPVPVQVGDGHTVACHLYRQG